MIAKKRCNGISKTLTDEHTPTKENSDSIQIVRNKLERKKRVYGLYKAKSGFRLDKWKNDLEQPRS